MSCALKVDGQVHLHYYGEMNAPYLLRWAPFSGCYQAALITGVNAGAAWVMSTMNGKFSQPRVTPKQMYKYRATNMTLTAGFKRYSLHI